MKTRHIKWQFLAIPFKEKFTHHSAEREKTETAIFQLTNEDDVTAFGESCPRKYVTKEEFKTLDAFFRKFKKQLEVIQDIDELKTFMKTFQTDIDKNPAAWCSVELAFLDLLAKEDNQSVEELLLVQGISKDFTYTGVIGIDTWYEFFKKALKYRLYGFSDFKIKLSGNSTQDKKALSILALLGVKKNNIRVDGNNLWSSEEKAISYLTPLKKYIWAIEEPLMPNKTAAMARIAQALDVKIILDESFLNAQSLLNIKDQDNIFIPNLRISKLGGVLRTLEIINELEKQNFKWILGSHVGEMSLLTRASLMILNSQASSSFLIAKEGAFSTHLLTEDPFYPNLKFSFGAKIKKNLENKIGWGMTFLYKKKDQV